MALDDKVLLDQINYLSDYEFLASITSSYPEMKRLTEPVRGSPESQMVPNDHSSSKKLFGKQHIEFDRTAVGILAVKWVLAGNYDQFTTGQPESLRLKRESFEKLRNATLRLVERKELSALVTSLAFNDLGKVIGFVESVEQRIGSQEVDHDNILLTALRRYSDLVPSFAKLRDGDQKMILKGMGAKFNLGQFVQAENLPANLKGLQGLSKDELDFNNMHTLFDVAGARGHVISNGAVVLNEPTFQYFFMAFYAMDSIESDDKSLIKAYDHYLKKRVSKLSDQYHIDALEDRAIARLSFMMRCDSADQFNQMKIAFSQLSDNAKRVFVTELNKSGVNDHGILLYYAPAVIVNARTSFKQNPHEGLMLALSYLAELFSLARVQNPDAKTGVYTVDCAALAEKIKNPGELNQCSMELQSVGADARVVLKLKSKV